ncbi:hypothetical protein FE257_008095 [Aspergillus nanangensis]|uniref:FAD-binding domain-containing protein n=1 Tax=Aspergillus nanangensis TaxID=2582783 RepID=A0AAD4GTS1_ASPNN|nr:hypothetical protein FE257_008095 [Aspergillus nanangensis]
MVADNDEVAIIGAGLCGLTLALALQQQSIPCSVYEARSAPKDIGGAIVLSPNALQILDMLGVYPRIKSRGHESEAILFRTQDDQIVDSYELGNEQKYGYKSLRIYRHWVIEELLRCLSEKNIPVQFEKKFEQILSESNAEVIWEFADGSIGRAGSLIGADGVYSRVRSYLYPDVKPHFIGIVGVAAYVPTTQVDIPEGYQLPVTIMGDTNGGYIIGPQKADGSEMMLGRQRRWPEVDREGWKALAADKKWCLDFLRHGAEDFPIIIRTSVANICQDKIDVWPFYIVPKLDSWISETGRVAIVGDAAHALPPSSGQGANQVFEDAWTYARVRCQCKSASARHALAKWNQGRQERIDRLLEFADEITRRRMPNSRGDSANARRRITDYLDFDWVFKCNYELMIQDWLAS